MSDHLFHPALLSELLDLQRAVDSSASLLLLEFSHQRPSALELRSKLGAQMAYLEKMRIKKTLKPAWIDRHDAARSLVEHADEVIGLTEELVSAMALIFAQRELGAALDELRFSTSATLQKLSAIRSKVSRLTPVHQRVQRHLALAADEYAFGDRSHRDDEYRKTITWAFYMDLAIARDAFFEEADVEHLRGYLATAERLLEREHPLKADVDGAHVKWRPSAAESASEIYAELVRDELMFELLEVKR